MMQMDTWVYLFEFPSSLLLAILFVVATYALHRYAAKWRVVRWLSTSKAARLLLLIGAVMLAVEGVWSLPVHSSLPFAIYLLVLMLSLSFTVLAAFERKAKIGFICNHLGLLIIILAAFFGAPDATRGKAIVAEGKTVNIAYSSDQHVVPLPFDVSLVKFTIDYYDDGVSPKQYMSQLLVDGKQLQTSVNHPCFYRGYAIYQEGYDHKEGKYTILQFVRDPWLPVVYVGMLLLAVGSVLLLFGKWKTKLVVPVAIVLTVLFTIFTVAKINFGTLMPALRSWWFVPHLFIYMVAYALMAIGLVLQILKRESANMLIQSSSALLIIGMLIGAVWARQAWGDYWAWDPKENWAAVTWFLSLIYLHVTNRKSRIALWVVVVAFLSLQVTWYGVSYLPSAKDSMHTYNQ